MNNLISEGMKGQKEKESTLKKEQALPKFVLKNGHQLQEVFEIDGLKYYEFVDANMAPCHRMFTGMAYYNELKMRCDKDYLIAFCNAILDVFKVKDGQAIDIGKIPQLARQTLERVEWILEPETIFKYASVVIFDETEDPYSYDFKYNNEVKIPKWKQERWADFFLRMPVQKLFPLSSLSPEDLGEYLKTQAKVNLSQLENIFSTLSNNSSIKDSVALLISQSKQALV